MTKDKDSEKNAKLPRGFEWTDPIGCSDEASSLSDRMKSEEITNPADGFHDNGCGAYNSGNYGNYENRGITQSSITTENLIVGDGGSINNSAITFFQQLERLVQESKEISEEEKPGILASLKNLTYHPAVIAAVQKLIEVGVKGGA